MSYQFIYDLNSKLGIFIERLRSAGDGLRAFRDQHPANVRRTVTSIDELNQRLQRLNSQRTASTSISDIRALRRDINQTEREIRRLENLPPRGFGERLRGIGGQLGGLVGIAGGVGLAMSAWDGIKTIFNKGVELEQANTKFEVLLGSSEKAQKMLGNLTQYADTTPFGLDGLQKGAETMLGFGIAEEKIMPTMKMLGDVAMGNEEKLGGLSLVYSQIQATGRLMGQDLLQLINQGFNPLQVISDQTGLSMGELKNRMENGAISADMVTEAFRIATSEGGRYHGMTEKMGETAGGKLSTMLDAFSGVVKKVGLRFAEWVKPIFDVGTSFAEKIIPFGKWVLGFMPSLDTFTTMLKVLGIAVAAIGTYFLIANASAILLAIDMGILNGVIAITEGLIWLTTAAQWALNFAMNMNPIGIVIAVIVALVAAIVLLWDKFGWLRGSVLGVWEVLKGLGSMIKNYVINRFQELLAGITGIGKALVKFISGDFSGAMEEGAKAGANLLGVGSKAKALQDGKEAFKSFNKGWVEGNKETAPSTAQKIVKTNEKAAAAQPKSKLFDSLLTDTGKGGKTGKEKTPKSAKEKSSGITSGGNKQTNIVINIDKVGTGTTINVSSVEKGLNNLGERVQEELLRAINSVNQMQVG